MIKMVVEKEMTKAQVTKVLTQESSKSEKIKTLFLGGMDVKTISELMGIRYNFAYNVVSDMIRVEGLQSTVQKTEKASRKEEIHRLIKEGKTNVEISTELKCNYNYVWKVVNEYYKNK